MSSNEKPWSREESIFYNNVSILAKAETTSKDFDNLFSKEMFRKQNTPGFMHVTYFLLNIYNTNMCKKMIIWPCICKQDETKFRKNCNEFFEIIQEQNPDLPFPSGVATCLFQATGTKFMIIMSRLSIIVLRTYIKNNSENYVFIPSLTPDIDKKLVREMAKVWINQADEAVDKYLEEKKIEKKLTDELSGKLKAIKIQLNKKPQELAQVVEKAPINVQEDKKKLLDYKNNDEVVELWQKTIIKNLDYVKKGSEYVAKIDSDLNKIITMKRSIIDDQCTLNGNTLQKIDVDNILHLLDPETQIVARRLYENDQLVLLNFFKVFYKIAIQLCQHLKRIDFAGIDMLCKQLEVSAEDLNAMYPYFQSEQQNFLELRDNLQPKIQTNIDLLSSPCTDNSFYSPIRGQQMSSIQKIEHQKKINLTPVFNTHVSLFSKYKTETSLPISSAGNLSLNNQLLRVNLDDSIQSFRSDITMTQRIDKTRKLNRSNKDIINKYSRIFSTRKRMNDFSGKLSLSLMSKPNANSTAVMTIIGEEPQSSTFNCNQQNSSSINLSIPEVPTITESEQVEPKLLTVPKIVLEPSKDDKPTNRRRSITDLLNRYKTIFKNQGTN